MPYLKVPDLHQKPIREPRRRSQSKIREFFEDPAKTRLARKSLITMPLKGHIGHIEPGPGDAVNKGSNSPLSTDCP